jgi:hypothetical protein
LHQLRRLRDADVVVLNEVDLGMKLPNIAILPGNSLMLWA